MNWHFPKPMPLNEEFNDMGLVYLRQGAPDDIARHSYSPFDDEDVQKRISDLSRLPSRDAQTS